VSHAQLFFGPEGSGKLAIAIAYAQYISCENRTDEDSCGHCPSCVKYEKLIHPDLHFVYPVATTKKVTTKPISKSFIDKWRELLLEMDYYISLSNWYSKIEIENKQGIINADDCNEIIKTLSYKSYESEFKVMIIWMAEKLFHAAAPKILKILEEPPDKTLFILISENQDQIIKTILSRTQLVKIPRLSNEELYEAIDQRYKLKTDEIQDIVNLSSGNYHKAVSFIAQSGESGEYFKQFSRWMRLCYQLKIAELVKFAEEISKTGREPQKSFISYALRFVRECLMLQYGHSELIGLNPEEKKFAQNFAPYVNASNGDLFSEELNRSLYHIERNANPSILFLDLSLKVNKLLKLKPTN